MNQIKDGKMPLYSYVLILGNAKLTGENKEKIINWFIKSRDHW